jgi:hypothetical protein
LAGASEGGTTRSITIRIADEDRDSGGLAPWPVEITEQDVEAVLREHRNRRVALYARRLVSRTGLGGLAGRISRA